MSHFSNDIYMVSPQPLKKQNETKLSLHYSRQYSGVVSDFSVADFAPVTTNNNIEKATDKTIKQVNNNTKK